MEFKGPYLRAMAERAPKMFMQLRREGALDAFVKLKCEEAARLLDDLTKGAPTLANGLAREPYLREAEETVRAILIEFPPDES